MTAPPLAAALGSRLLAALAEARERTLLLLAPVTEDELRTQYNPLMGPILWDLGHIAHFEDLWLLRNTTAPAGTPLAGELPGVFNPFENPRRVRGELQLPSLDETLTLLADVRRRVEDRLAALPFDDADPLLRDGFVVRMVAQHEHQHGETILQALQLKGGAPYRAPRGYDVPPPRIAPSGRVRFPGGAVEIGTGDRSAAYDNERPLHRVPLAPFEIDATPVTNGAYLAFLDDDGYTRRELWSEEGWAWRTEEEAVAPLFWTRRDGGWWSRSMDREAPVDPLRPVCHVSWHEAEAFARWAGGRLPTEEEWEAAATWDPDAERKRTFPWGDEAPTAELANVDQLAFETAPMGAYPRNVSPIGCYGMIGDVWEWTASTFAPYLGFEVFPYREYSEVFFDGASRVLRGGSWATRPGAIRGTFRNWDYPIRRQIFSGFRCAYDG